MKSQPAYITPGQELWVTLFLSSHGPHLLFSSFTKKEIDGMREVFKRLAPIYLTVFLLFLPALSTYFAQDDFFHLKASLTDGSFRSFIRLFGIYRFEERGYAFYRPIFREGLYNIFYNLFGLNPLPFRILLFSIHFINIYLVYTLINKLLKNQQIAIFSSFFFGIRAANVAPLFMAADFKP
jgi:hypothetical protein